MVVIVTVKHILSIDEESREKIIKKINSTKTMTRKRKERKLIEVWREFRRGSER